jgi:hypothetical protein
VNGNLVKAVIADIQQSALGAGATIGRVLKALPQQQARVLDGVPIAVVPGNKAAIRSILGEGMLEAGGRSYDIAATAGMVHIFLVVSELQTTVAHIKQAMFHVTRS